MALAPAGSLACAPLAAAHAPVADTVFAARSSLVRSTAVVAAAASLGTQAAAGPLPGARTPEVASPWQAPSSPAPSQAPPAA